MDLSRMEQRAARVAFITGLSAMVSAALQIVSVPVCLYFWGKETYGVWLSIYSLIMMFRVTDAGYSAYVGNKINLLYHQNLKATRETLASAAWGCLLIGLIQLLMGMAVLISGRLPVLLGMQNTSTAGLQLDLALVVLVVSWVLVGPYIGTISRLMIPAGIMYQAGWWTLAWQASQFFAIMGAAAFRADIFQTSIIFSLTQSAGYLLSAVYVRRKIPAFYPWWQRSNFSTGIRDLRKSSMLTVSNLVQQGSTSGFVVVLAAFSGAAAVPVFTTMRSIVNLWITLANVLSMPLLPEIVRYHATGDGIKLMSTQKAHWFLAGTAVNLSILLIFPVIGPVYRYWTAGELDYSKPLIIGLLAAIALTNLGSLIITHMTGVNKLNVLLAMNITRGTIAIGLGTALLMVVGIAGLGIAIFAGELVGTLILGSYFFRREIAAFGGSFTFRSMWPVILSTLSLIMFLILQLSDAFEPVLLELVAAAGVALAAWGGWRQLDEEVKIRFRRLARPGTAYEQDI